MHEREKNEFKSYYNDSHIFYVQKARTAIKRACTLMGLGHGNEILAPAYNCGSEVDALLSSGCSVTLYRITDSCNIDIDDLQQRITDKTKAVYVTHYFGFPQPSAAIKHICEEHNLYLFEDCALALFSRDGCEPLGKQGDVSVFSLPKTLPVPDGGMLVINNLDLMKDNWILKSPNIPLLIRGLLPLLKSGILRYSNYSPKILSFLKVFLNRKKQINISFDKFIAGNRKDMPKDYYYDERLSNRSMSWITKNLLNTFQVNEIISKRSKCFCYFINSFKNCSHIKPLYDDLPQGICPLYYPVLVKDRDHVWMKLNQKSIPALAWWAGYHKGFSWESYPEACFLKNNLLCLPVNHELTECDLDFISETLISI